MKRFQKAALLLAALFTLTACAGCAGGQSSSQAAGGGDVPSDTSQAGEKRTIGIVQLIDNGAFEDMREGFIARLRELGYTEDKLEIQYKNASGDASNLNAICQEMVDQEVDLIAAIATPSAQAVANLGSDIPMVFISVSNPQGAGIISDMEHPDKNATGTSNAIPVDEMFALSDRLTPGKQTYGLIYNTGETNSVTTIESAKAYLDSQGLGYIEKTVANSGEVQQAAQSLVGSVDAFFIPNDSVVQSAMPQLAQVAMEAKLPVYGSSAVMVASGAFATVSISDTEIGAISADMADQYLQGTPIEEIPAVVVDSFTTVINKTTAEAIGADLSGVTDENVVYLEGIA